MEKDTINFDKAKVTINGQEFECESVTINFTRGKNEEGFLTLTQEVYDGEKLLLSYSITLKTM